MKRLLIAAFTMLLHGCAASLEDFHEMSTGERIDYVCENHAHVRSLSSEISELESEIQRTRTAIERGYHLHHQCKKVLVDGDLDCKETGDGLHCTRMAEYRTVCEDVPVAIDGDLELDKLDQYIYHSEEAFDRREQVYSRCEIDVAELSPAEAYGYYLQTR